MAIKALDGGMGGGAAPKLENFTVLPNNTPSVRFGTNISLKKDPMGEQVEKLIDVGVKIKNQIDDDDANDAATKYMQYCAESAQNYRQMQNDSALKDADGNDVLTGINEDRESYKSSLYDNMSSEARAKFEERVAGTDRGFYETTQSHRYDQLRNVRKTHKDALIDGFWSNTNSALEQMRNGNISDDDGFKQIDENIENSIKASLDYLKTEGYSDDDAQYLSKIGMQEYIKKTWEYWGDQDSDVARKFYEKYKGLLPADVQSDMNLKTAQLEDEQHGAQDAEDALKSGFTYVGGDSGGSSTVASNLDSFKGIIKDRIVRHESGGNWKKRNGAGSSASGLYQITDENIRGINKKYGTHFTYADKTDPKKGEQIFQYVAKEHYDEAKKLTGRSSFSAGEVYQIWFLGPAGFAKMSKASPNSLVTDNLVGNSKQQDMIRAQNRTYLYTNNGKGRAMTVAEFRSFMDRKTSKGGTGKKVAIATNATNVDDMMRAFKQAHPNRSAHYYRSAEEIFSGRAAHNRDQQEIQDRQRAVRIAEIHSQAADYNFNTWKMNRKVIQSMTEEDQKNLNEWKGKSPADQFEHAAWLLTDPNIKNMTMTSLAAISGGNPALINFFGDQRDFYKGKGKANGRFFTQGEINTLYSSLGLRYGQKLSDDQKKELGRAIYYALDSRKDKAGREKYPTMSDAFRGYASVYAKQTSVFDTNVSDNFYFHAPWSDD